MASRSVNKVILVGHLGKDAETKFTQGGTPVTKFTIATGRRWKDQQSGEWKEETDWHNVVLWRAENLANYLLKGKQVYIEGRLQTRSYEDKDGKKQWFTEVVCRGSDPARRPRRRSCSRHGRRRSRTCLGAPQRATPSASRRTGESR